MKTYIDYDTHILFENKSIPKDLSNLDYIQHLTEIEAGEAELVSPPSPLSWEYIRSQRDALLKECDWITASDATPKPSKQAWLDYRKSLRDLPQQFENAEEVVWPTIPTAI